MACLVESKRSLSDLASEVSLYPQVLLNVRYQGEQDPLQSELVLMKKEEIEAKLGNRGRVLLRKSGTEPLIRVMVEGKNGIEVQSAAEQLVEAVRSSC